jgi:hypothetical protein
VPVCGRVWALNPRLALTAVFLATALAWCHLNSHARAPSMSQPTWSVGDVSFQLPDAHTGKRRMSTGSTHPIYMCITLADQLKSTAPGEPPRRLRVSPNPDGIRVVEGGERGQRHVERGGVPTPRGCGGVPVQICGWTRKSSWTTWWGDGRALGARGTRPSTAASACAR